MKNILLTTSALVAFAGAAAADGHTSVSWSGEASAEYNSVSGYATAAELTASASATLSNGLTATTSIDIDGAAGTVSFGDITVANDTVTVTFGEELHGAAFAAVGDDYGTGAGEDGSMNGLTAEISLGTATVYVSAPGLDDLDASAIEVGVSATVGDIALNAALANGDYAVTGSSAVAGASVGFGLATDGFWDASLSYPTGDLTLSFETDEASAWTLGASYSASDELTAGIEYNADETYEATLAYAAGDAVFNAGFDGSNVELSAGYTTGDIYAEIGLTYGAEAYVTANYDLGGGASAYVSYAEAEEIDIAEDVAEGTTVGVSFNF